MEKSTTSMLLNKNNEGVVEEVSKSFTKKTPNYDTATNLFVKGPNDSDTQTDTLQSAASQGYPYTKLDNPSVLKKWFIQGNKRDN